MSHSPHGATTRDPQLGLLVQDIARVKFPEELTPEKFERNFVHANEPVIIEGLIDDWPAYKSVSHAWNGSRLDAMSKHIVEVNYDPIDEWMYRFDYQDPSVVINPGRLLLPMWAFLETGRIRQSILEMKIPAREINLAEHPELQQRLDVEVQVQNAPLSFEPDVNNFLVPFTVRLRDLIHWAFYLAHDLFALPENIQSDVPHLAPKLMPAWGEPSMAFTWITSGGAWKTPDRKWCPNAAPIPGVEKRLYSSFHFDRMENLHSILSGEKDVFLVSPERAQVLKGTRFAPQLQWIVGPLDSSNGKDAVLGPTLIERTDLVECSSDLSAIAPCRSAECNRLRSQGQWPEHVDYPVLRGRLRPGDTLYIPAHHWHFIATTAPPSLGEVNQGAFAASVNFWWWPLQEKDGQANWTHQNEIWSRSYATYGDPRELVASYEAELKNANGAIADGHASQSIASMTDYIIKALDMLPKSSEVELQKSFFLRQAARSQLQLPRGDTSRHHPTLMSSSTQLPSLPSSSTYRPPEMPKPGQTPDLAQSSQELVGPPILALIVAFTSTLIAWTVRQRCRSEFTADRQPLLIF